MDEMTKRMFTTTEDEPAILHAWLHASFLGGCTADEPDALLDHATDWLQVAGLEDKELKDAIDEINIDYAPIPELEAGDLHVSDEMCGTDPDATYLCATIYTGGKPIGEVTLRDNKVWGSQPSHWACPKIQDWFSNRGTSVYEHRHAIVDAVQDAIVDAWLP